jgi:hypothetical protein
MSQISDYQDPSREELLNLEQGDELEPLLAPEDSILNVQLNSSLGFKHLANGYDEAVIVNSNHKILFAGSIQDYEFEVAGICHDEKYEQLTERRVKKMISGNEQAFVRFRNNGFVANGKAWEIEVEDRLEGMIYRVQVMPEE